MNEIVSSQALLFITSVEIGIVMGMIFDLIRVMRKIVKHPNFLVQVEDLLYWIVCGLIGFYMLYVTNYAEIRPFILIGIILGGVFYFATFSIVFMKAATAIINYVKALLKRLWQLFLIPVRWSIKTIKRPIIYANKQIALEKERQRVAYRKKRREKYQQEADKLTEKYVNAKLKKINLEEKHNEKLKKQAEEAHKKEALAKAKEKNASQTPKKKTSKKEIPNEQVSKEKALNGKVSEKKVARKKTFKENNINEEKKKSAQ